MKTRNTHPPFHLLRFFSLTSLLSILLVALVIIYFYRFMVISVVNDLGTELNTSTAKSALKPIHDDLEQFIARRSLTPSQSVDVWPAEDTALKQAIDSLIGDAGIVRAKVYARDGTVLYSTNHEQIGRNQIDNKGFSSAIKGKISNKLVYQDHLNPFDEEISDENLVQTYLPVISSDSRRPIGVFEIYSDANNIVATAAKAQLIVIPVVLGILLALYLLLLTIVRRASTTIEQQRNVIAERTHTLELLSAKLLHAQEDERKRLAHSLHEGVAQSLLAVKLGLENQRRQGDSSSSGPLVALVQDAITQAREFAIELRPAALDDFGVLKTLNTFFRELKLAREDLQLRWGFDIDESDIPKPLKTIIFRVVQDTVRSLTRETDADRIQVTLSARDNRIQLDIVENSYAYHYADGDSKPDAGTQAAIALMRERTTLSGGEFEIGVNSEGKIRNTASWPV